jgi:MraZ protein
MRHSFGTVPHKLDPAGRIKLRDDERAALGSRVYIAYGHDHYLNVFTPEAWGAFCADFKKLPLSDPDVLDLRRLLVSTGQSCEIDAQGRMKIPDPLLKWAHLGKEKLQAYLLQQEEGRWECWEVGAWHDFQNQRAEALKQKAREIFGARAASQEVIPAA